MEWDLCKVLEHSAPHPSLIRCGWTKRCEGMMLYGAEVQARADKVTAPEGQPLRVADQRPSYASMTLNGVCVEEWVLLKEARVYLYNNKRLETGATVLFWYNPLTVRARRHSENLSWSDINSILHSMWVLICLCNLYVRVINFPEEFKGLQIIKKKIRNSFQIFKT